MKKQILLGFFSILLSAFCYGQNTINLPSTALNLPVTFDDVTVNYDLVDFGGNASSIVTDPVVPANKVCKIIKGNTAETWAGTTIGGSTGGFATAIPFAVGATTMTMRVYSPDAGTPIRLKVEDPNDATKSVETQVNTTVANAWQTLTFNFANQATGTAPINYSYTYKKLSIFCNFGVTGAVAGTKTYYCDDIIFVTPVLTQVNLPVTFDDPTVNYNLVDFGGNASSIVTDPVVPTNKACKIIKSNTAELWAGTTIGGATGMATAIPFVAGSTKISMRVYSPNAGIPIRMKVEVVGDPTKSVETEKLTTVANAWETLQFDFANQATGTAPINFTYSYKMLSVFFNFGTTGAAAGTKTYYCDDIIFVVPVLTQVNLPVTFDVTTVNYDLVDFGGNASSIVTDPVVPANKACKVIKSNVAELWAGTTIGGTTGGFATAIPFVPNATAMSMRVYSPNAGIPVRMKVEDPNDATKSVEVQVNTTVANAWETLIFVFANQVTGTAAINYSYTYKKLSVFFNFGTTGAVAGTKTYYFDDVIFIGSLLAHVNLPVTFDDPNVNYDLLDFGGNASSIVIDPAESLSLVCKVIKSNTAQTWAGTTIGGYSNGFLTAIPFAPGATSMTIKVFSPNAGIPVRVKVEDPNDPTKSVETEKLTSLVNIWETLTFNFANQAAGTAPINYTYTYKKLSIFFNFGTSGVTAGTKTYYFDNVIFVGSTLIHVDLPVNFENPNVNYDLVDFGGNAASIVNDPVAPANKACKVIKSNTAELWAGTTIGGTTGGFTNKVPFAPGSTKMTMRVYSPDAGIPVRMKVEDPNDPTKSVETQLNTTLANNWETLTFNFANQASGTAPINFTYNYKKLSVFFNFGVTGAAAGTKTYYFDDVAFDYTVTTQLTLPVTFDDPTINYDLIDFGGNTSSIVSDPVAPANRACKIIKGNTAETWAGTTIGGSTGFATAFPFAIGSTSMTMRVYSPDAATPVRMKVEDPNDPTKSVETQVLTTKVNTWETLTFNFANQAPGTAAINYTYNYKKLSVFFNFGVTGASAGVKTYYCDDIAFGGAAPSSINVTFKVQSPDSSLVYIFGSWTNWGNWPGDPMTSIGNNIYTKTLQLTANSNFEFLYVNGNAPVKEVLNPAWSCTNNNPQYTNRVLALSSLDTTLCFEWASCLACGSAPIDSITVTFKVQNPDSIPVYVFGNWSNWSNWPGTPMTTTGNNIYETTMRLKSNQNVEYLFVNGVGPTKEVLDPSWSCTNGNTQYTNRLSALSGTADTTICFLWNHCLACGTTSVNTLQGDDIKVNLGHQGIRVFSNTITEADQIGVYDMLGRTVYFSDKKQDLTNLIPMRLSSGSIYLITIKNNNRIFTFKGILMD